MRDQTPRLSIKVRLQDQDDAYSPSETVVYHWDRIGLALGVLALTASIAVWGGWQVLQSPEEATPAPGVVIVDTPAAAPSLEVPDSDAEPEPEPEPEPAGIKGGLPVLGEPGLASPRLVETEPEDTAVAPLPAAPDALEAADRTAAVEILSEHLSRAQLTSGLRDKEPVDAAPALIPMNADGLIRVYFFTRMDDLQGQTVHHDWYLGDERMARVTIGVYTDRMRASSSKFIDRHMLGNWRVVVQTDAGERLARTAFEVR